MEIDSIWVNEEDAVALRKLVRRRKIILASASPRRKRVLDQCGISFVVAPVEVDETIDPDRSPWGHVVRWSRIKAKAAMPEWKNGLIMAADTVVAIDGLILGKPKNKADAGRLLRMLSGKTHTVFTGVTIVDLAGQDICHGWQATKVRFHRLIARQIREYIAGGEPLDKAGAYGIQGRGRELVAAIDGPLDNVVGLPVGKLVQLIKRLRGKTRQ